MVSPPELHVIVDQLTREAFNNVAGVVQKLDATRAIEDFNTSLKPGSSI